MTSKQPIKAVVISILLCITPYLAYAEDFDPMGKLTNFSRSLAQASENRVHISGYANAHYMIHDGVPESTNPSKNLNDPLFQLREASIFLDATLSNNLLFSTELELSYDFSSKNTSGHEDRYEAALNYYYIDYDISSAGDWNLEKNGSLSIRAGRILVPFNDYNENKANFKQFLMSQPFTAWQLVPVNNVAVDFHNFGWTDTGLSFDWYRAINDTGIFNIKFSMINGLGSDDPDVLDNNSIQLNPPGAMKPTVRPRDGLFGNKTEWDSFSDGNDNKAIVVKLSYQHVAIPLNLGVSWYSGKWDENDQHNLQMIGTHFNYIETDWTIRGEWVRAEVEQDAGTNPVTAPGPAGINTSTGDYRMHAWYLEGSYIPYRYGKDRKRYVRLIARYDDVDTNDKAVFTPFDRSRVTLGTEWEFLQKLRLRYEWQRSSIDNFDNAPDPYKAAGGNEHIDMKMLSIIAYF